MSEAASESRSGVGFIPPVGNRSFVTARSADTLYGDAVASLIYVDGRPPQNALRIGTPSLEEMLTFHSREFREYRKDGDQIRLCKNICRGDDCLSAGTYGFGAGTAFRVSNESLEAALQKRKVSLGPFVDKPIAVTASHLIENQEWCSSPKQSTYLVFGRYQGAFQTGSDEELIPASQLAKCETVLMPVRYRPRNSNGTNANLTIALT